MRPERVSPELFRPFLRERLSKYRAAIDDASDHGVNDRFWLSVLVEVAALTRCPNETYRLLPNRINEVLSILSSKLFIAVRMDIECDGKQCGSAADDDTECSIDQAIKVGLKFASCVEATFTKGSLHCCNDQMSQGRPTTVDRCLGNP